jgi:hypothetical protein
MNEGPDDSHEWPQSKYEAEAETRRPPWRFCNICNAPTLGTSRLDVPLCWRQRCQYAYEVKLYLVTLQPFPEA